QTGSACAATCSLLRYQLTNRNFSVRSPSVSGHAGTQGLGAASIPWCRLPQPEYFLKHNAANLHRILTSHPTQSRAVAQEARSPAATLVQRSVHALVQTLLHRLDDAPELRFVRGVLLESMDGNSYRPGPELLPTLE